MDIIYTYRYVSLFSNERSCANLGHPQRPAVGDLQRPAEEQRADGRDAGVRGPLQGRGPQDRPLRRQLHVQGLLHPQLPPPPHALPQGGQADTPAASGAVSVQWPNNNSSRSCQ